ncbi:hypothetical protein VRK_16870 [Vibrio sp. MEBiC08052]|nr:hypothetical protein VRK_16870 [Vibrio sp. MEBiC08052]
MTFSATHPCPSVTPFGFLSAGIRESFGFIIEFTYDVEVCKSNCYHKFALTVIPFYGR